MPGAGRGVFAQRDVAAGTTLTEWVGLVAAPPATHADEMELMQARALVESFKKWRRGTQKS